MTDNLLLRALHHARLRTGWDRPAAGTDFATCCAGELGTQDAGDEPASKSLEQIKKQIKKFNDSNHEKEISPFDEQKIPFSLPKNWVWTQIGIICTPTQYGWTTKVR